MRILNQVYASRRGVPLRYDMLAPDGDEPYPLIVCLHGGGWISGQKEDMREVVALLAASGFAAATISYRLAPLHTFPAAVEDAMSFVRYARANAEDLGINPAKIAALGTSAGGHLAAMLGVLDGLPNDDAQPSARVQAVVDLCGIADLVDPRDKHLPISWSFVDQFIGVPYDGNEDLYKLASPVSHVSPESAEFIIFHGENDDVVPIAQSEALAAALREHSVPVELVRYPGEAHGFSMEVWPDLVDRTIRFLHRAFAKDAAPVQRG